MRNPFGDKIMQLKITVENKSIYDIKHESSAF